MTLHTRPSPGTPSKEVEAPRGELWVEAHPELQVKHPELLLYEGPAVFDANGSLRLRAIASGAVHLGPKDRVARVRAQTGKGRAKLKELARGDKEAASRGRVLNQIKREAQVTLDHERADGPKTEAQHRSASLKRFAQSEQALSNTVKSKSRSVRAVEVQSGSMPSSAGSATPP